jgi:hypothetical protein
MSKKFMIVKPRECCGFNGSVGYISQSDGKQKVVDGYCLFCKAILNNVLSITDSSDGVMFEVDRIIWLPDESDVIDHDMREELAA